MILYYFNYRIINTVMKKWTYLVAAGLLAGATPVFTGCIDNEEPEGITVLRGAKAELLKAKAAVEQASIAEIQARAALLEAQAATEKAEAAIKEAQAKVIEAQAKQIEAQTEAEKQAAALELEAARAEMEQQAALAEVALKQAELNLQTMQAQYEQALIDLATAKLTLTSAQQKALQPYVTALQTAQKEYDTKAKAVVAAQRAVIAAAKDVDGLTETEIALATRELEKAVKDSEITKAATEKGLEDAKAELAEAQGMEPSELIVKRDAAWEAYEKLNLEVADLRVVMAEKRNEMQADFDEQASLQGAIQEVQDAPITIAPFKYKFPESFGLPLSYLSTYWGELEVVPEIKGGITYSLNDPAAYSKYLFSYMNHIQNLTSMVRDENDKAWTTEQIAVLEAQLKNWEEGALKEAISKWQQAVKVYKTGTAEADYKQFAGYAGLDEAVTAYNKEVEGYNTALAAKNEAQKEVDAAWEKYYMYNHPQIPAGWQLYNIELQEIANTRDEAKASAEEEYNKAIANFNDTDNKLGAARDVKQAEYNKALNNANAEPENEELAKAVETAKTALDAALKAYQDFAATWNDVYSKATAVKDRKIQIALDEYNIAKAKSYEKNVKGEFDKISESLRNEADAQLQAIWDAINNAQTALDAELEKFQTIQETVEEAVNKVSIAYSNYNWGDINGLNGSGSGYYIIDNVKWNVSRGVETFELSITEIAAIDKALAERIVKSRSVSLYGSMVAEGDNDELYQTPSQQLLELTEEQINEIIASKFEDPKIWQYAQYYENFGAVGRKMALETEIAIRKAYNADESANAISAAIEAFNAQLDALKAANDAQLEAWEAAQDAYDQKVLANQAVMAPYEEAITKKDAESKPRYMIWQAYQSAVTAHEENGDKLYSEEDIKNLIKGLEETITELEEAVFTAEGNLLRAQDNLAKWNAEEIEMLDLKKQALEDAEADLAIAQRNLDSANKALQDAIQRINSVTE